MFLFCLQGGKGRGSPRRQLEGGSVFIEKPSSPRRMGGGGNIFFPGPRFPQRKVVKKSSSPLF